MEILIVEDEPAVAGAMAGALESRGHAVRVAASAEEALALPRPDILITDLQLSGLSGLDLLEEYRRLGPAPRTIVVTGNPSLESCRRALRLGACEFLSKPLRLNDLVRAVENGEAARPILFRASYAIWMTSVGECVRDLAGFLVQRGVGPTCRARICTAVSELIENVVNHAYPDVPGDVHLKAIVEEREVVVTVADDGVGFSSEKISARHLCSPLHDGLARASSLAEGIEIDTRPGQGASISLRFGSYHADYDDGENVDLSELDFFSPSTSRQILHALQVEGTENFFQLSPALAVVIGRFLSGPDPEKVVPQALWS